MNNLNLCELPYIEIPEIPGKLLIDSGSSKSLLKPNIVEEKFKKNIYQNSFDIKTAHGYSSHKYRANILFRSLADSPQEFCLFNFNDKYSGLIGADFLRDNKARLDFNNNKLIIGNRIINISFPYDYTLEPQSERKIKIPVNKPNGLGLIDQTSINNIFIPDCLIESSEGQAYVKITNPTSVPVSVKIRKPFEMKEVEKKFNYSIEHKHVCSKNTWVANEIRTDHLNYEEKEELLRLCNEYSDIFAKENEPLTSTHVVKHKIRTTDDIPIHSKLYRYPQVHKEEVERQIDKMLQQNIIRHSHSPWCSPIWVVPKKEDASGKKKWRIVVDYRKLNDKTIPDRYPIPKIEEILDKIGRSQYFSTIDLISGFHQIEIHPDDIEKTAFSTDSGHFEYLRMPFGLNNAPSTFQRLMNNVLHGLIGKTCLVYMDDVIVFSTSLQEHLEKLNQIFDRFRRCQLKIQLDKSEFLKKEAEFLGHVVTPDGIKPNPRKLEAIRKYPIPKTTREIKSFLGLIGYYRKFIKDFAHVTKPITKCLKKNAKIDVDNEEYKEAFNLCKQILINSPVLRPPDFSKEFILTTDASNVAIGAVLSQGDPNSDHPVAYASRTLNETETKYSTIEKELLAIVWATNYFRPYLYGKKFTIMTDHKPLKWLFSLKEPNSKLVRWRLKLEEYEYSIEYKKGKLNSVADALSRVEINPLEIDNQSVMNNVDDEEWSGNNREIINISDSDNDEEIVNINDSDNNQEIINISDSDTAMPDEIQEVINISDSDDNTINSNQESYAAPGIPILEEEIINNKSNQIFFIHSYTPEILAVRRGKRNVIIAKFNLIEPKSIENFVKQYCLPQKKYYCVFVNERDYELVSSAINQSFNNVQAPLFFRCMKVLEEIMQEDALNDTINQFHCGKSNHRATDETYFRMKKIYYYPNLKLKIDEFIKNCEICKQAKYDRHPLKIPLEHTPTPTKPMELLHTDTFQIESSLFVTILDPFSKFGQAFPIRSKNAIEICKTLIKFFSQYGSPKALVSDSGTEFCNETVKELLKSYQIEFHNTTPNNPNSNGPIERFHSTIIEHYRLFQTRFHNFKPIDLMPYCIFAYNSSIHSQTLKTPFDIIFGYTPELLNYDPEAIITQEYNERHKDVMKIVYQVVRERIEDSKEQMLNRNNRNSDQPFKEGDIVYKRISAGFHKKHKNPFQGPYSIISLLEHNKAIILSHKTDEQHITHLRNLRLAGGHAESSHS